MVYIHITTCYVLLFVSPLSTIITLVHHKLRLIFNNKNSQNSKKNTTKIIAKIDKIDLSDDSNYWSIATQQFVAQGTFRPKSVQGHISPTKVASTPGCDGCSRRSMGIFHGISWYFSWDFMEMSCGFMKIS